MSQDGLLIFEKVSKSFGGVRALRDVNLAVPHSAIVGLIGPNGAGKTTTFNVATCAHRITSGIIRFDGRPIHREPPHRIARGGMARTFQNIRLFHSLTVWEHVVIGLRAKDHPVARLMPVSWTGSAMRSQAERILALMGLTKLRHREATTLPYGVQRRVEIARALAGAPRLLLLDEPVAGMNPEEAAELRELVLRLRQEGLTILLIEHDMPFVMTLCDYLYVLDFGAVIAQGVPAAMQRDPAVIAAYLGSSAAHA
jgi:branched-chain amino acid transport system ATP-binding protein